MDGLILAAGRGTRLGPLGERLPKALLYLPGGRLIDYQIQLLQQSGIDRIFVVVGHLGLQLTDLLKPGHRHLDGRPEVGLAEGLDQIAHHAGRLGPLDQVLLAEGGQEHYGARPHEPSRGLMLSGAVQSRPYRRKWV